MKTGIGILSDPSGEAYQALIDYAIANSETFVLGLHLYKNTSEEALRRREHYAWLLDRLDPFLVRVHRYEELQGKSGVAYTHGHYYEYRCCEEAGRILKEASGSLQSWRSPRLSEDLSFRDKEGNDYLLNIAHERIGVIAVSEEEAECLSDRIEGLFLHLGRHSDFDRWLDDAIRHQPETIHIENFGITDIPARIGRFKRLKRLTIFEQDLRALPPELFEIGTIEELTVYAANLEAIPKEIGRLRKLRSLTICNGSYWELPASGIIPKDRTAITSLPGTIGQLEALEHLTINYTNIAELPEELARLRRLRFCDIANNRLDKPPAVLYRLRPMPYVMADKNPFLYKIKLRRKW